MVWRSRVRSPPALSQVRAGEVVQDLGHDLGLLALPGLHQVAHELLLGLAGSLVGAQKVLGRRVWDRAPIGVHWACSSPAARAASAQAMRRSTRYAGVGRPLRQHASKILRSESVSPWRCNWSSFL